MFVFCYTGARVPVRPREVRAREVREACKIEESSRLARRAVISRCPASSSRRAANAQARVAFVEEAKAAVLALAVGAAAVAHATCVDVADQRIAVEVRGAALCQSAVLGWQAGPVRLAARSRAIGVRDAGSLASLVVFATAAHAAALETWQRDPVPQSLLRPQPGEAFARHALPPHGGSTYSGGRHVEPVGQSACLRQVPGLSPLSSARDAASTPASCAVPFEGTSA